MGKKRGNLDKLTVLIVAKTRRGPAACVGAITADGRSIRLDAANKGTDTHAGMSYAVGDVWEIEVTPAETVVPPHVENVVVYGRRRLKQNADVVAAVERCMPPLEGAIDRIFDGLTQATSTGALYIAARTGIPPYSTHFWRTDQALSLDLEGKRVRYRYPTAAGGRTLAYVGFEEPLAEIPAGTLLRLSLAHWWQPANESNGEERCFVQLSGWFLLASSEAATPPASANLQQSTPAAERQQTTKSGDDLVRARTTLKQVFGFDSFRPLQAEIVGSVLAGCDTLAILPTGGGKSLCYQLPALLLDGLTVVVSPLIALMQDQVDALHQLGVPAVFLNSTVAYADYVAAVGRLRAGRIRLLYVAPETLLRTEMLLLLDQCHVVLLTIDEAHCISQWGHDFRQEYRQLVAVRRRYPAAACLALTATAAPRVQRDICAMLDMEDAACFVASFDRANLMLTARSRLDGLGQLREFLAAHVEQSGIVYCSTRRQVDQLVQQLNAHGYRALPYHAGLDDRTRAANQRAFVRDETPIMVATVAFGMGIDKSNVRFVVHYNLPSSIEQYYQEIGRAGRDDLPSDCLLLYSQQDMATQTRHIDEGAEMEQPGRRARLQAVMRYAQAAECRRKPLLAYFGEVYAGDNCGRCDACVQGIDAGIKTDVTDAAHRFLACVQQTGERFGISHVVQVLRGSQAAKVLKFRHERLPTHGAGRDLSEAAWKALAQQLLLQELLNQDMEHGTLSVTPRGRERLANRERVFAAIETVRTVETAPSAAMPPYDTGLFDALRALRRTVADDENVPPYIIFSDRTLAEMAGWLPQTEAAMLAVSGVGQVKFTRYGLRFMALIRDYGAKHNLNAPTQPASASQVTVAAPKRRWMEVGELFAAGTGVQALAEMYGVHRRTIVKHLCDYVQAGNRIDPAQVSVVSELAPEQQEAILQAFYRSETPHLTPIFEQFGGKVSYDELSLLRLVVLARAEQQ